MYYLNNRFYDSEVGRFINTDNTDILAVQDDLYDKNLYAYCDNNPINRFDKDGDIWTELALANGTSQVLAYGISMSVLKSAIISSASVILPVAVIAVVTVSVVTISVSYAKSKNNQKKNSKNGKKARDSSKNEQHGDNGRAMEKAQKQVQELREQQAKAKSKAEKKKIQIKIQNILETARKNGNGENHSQRAKR